MGVVGRGEERMWSVREEEVLEKEAQKPDEKKVCSVCPAAAP